MADISAAMVMELRKMSGQGMMDCKKALQETGGDLEQAMDLLRKKGLATLAKRAGRATSEGLVVNKSSDDGKTAVLATLCCETDFVARSDDFQEFAKNISMHIAASNPLGIQAEDVPEDIVNKEKEIYRAQALEMGKPENVIDKIVEGKLKKFFTDNCLMNQPYVKDPDKTISDLLTELIGKIGENITIKRFVRFQIGES